MMNMITSLGGPRDYGFQSTRAANRQALVVIASDAPETVYQLQAVCEFFDLAVEVVREGADLMQVLQENRPMAVITDVDGEGQDGFHTMKIVAKYDRDLPILLLTGGDPVMMGAADAVQNIWNLTMVTQSTGSHLAGQLADFLFAAGRRAGCMRLVPV
ncbi:response regulator [Rhodopila sp.]|uniref:response regulator n=1 Tax=Rhodopila sp. TaxID=2480087 RepID=UPI003D129048